MERRVLEPAVRAGAMAVAVLVAALGSACGGPTATTAEPPVGSDAVVAPGSTESAFATSTSQATITVATEPVAPAPAAEPTTTLSDLAYTRVSFRPVSLGPDADRLHEVLDSAGITVNPYWDSCVSLEITGWDPDVGDVDLFVHISATPPCVGEAISRFAAIRSSTVVTLAEACDGCSGGGVDPTTYLAIRSGVQGQRAISAKVGGGARWGFDSFEEVVIDGVAPATPAGPSGDFTEILERDLEGTPYRRYRVNPSTSLPIHTQPSVSSSSLGGIPTGAEVGVFCTVVAEPVSGPYAQNDRYWLLVVYNGIQGFVTDQYVVTRDDIEDRSLIPLC